MEQLRSVELKLADELFGMSSGYVLDFTNSTFSDFFRREVGIDIYDDAYAIQGGSKGKRLRALQGKVSERPEWTRGLFVSYAGFTDVSLQAFTARKIILADGMDIYDALARRLSIPDVIAAKIRHASEYPSPFERVRTYFSL